MFFQAIINPRPGSRLLISIFLCLYLYFFQIFLLKYSYLILSKFLSNVPDSERCLVLLSHKKKLQKKFYNRLEGAEKQLTVANKFKTCTITIVCFSCNLPTLLLDQFLLPFCSHSTTTLNPCYEFRQKPPPNHTLQ